MTRNDLLFAAGSAIFIGAAFFYAYVTQRTIWSIPTLLVGLCGLALVIVMQAEEIRDSF